MVGCAQAQSATNPFSYSGWTNDATAGIDPAFQYTHAAKFGWYAPSIVINEVNVNRDEGPTVSRGAKDRIELLVVQDGLSVNGMILRDFTASDYSDYSTTFHQVGGGWFRFKDVPLWHNLPAGTIIVLTTDNDYAERVVQDGTYLWVHLYNPAYFDWAGDFDIESRDMVMIKDGSAPAVSVGRPYTSAITGTLGSIHTIQGGKSDGDAVDPILGLLALQDSFASASGYSSFAGIATSLFEAWVNDDGGWGNYFDVQDGKDISWPTIASAKLGGESSRNYTGFSGDVAVINRNSSLSDYNGNNEHDDGDTNHTETLSLRAWQHNTLGGANNASNLAFINALKATRRGVEVGPVAESGLAIDGLNFNRTKGPNPNSWEAFGFSTSGMDVVCEDNAVSLYGVSSSGELARGFVTGTGGQSLTITGLTPGRGYLLSLFSSGFEAPGNRWIRFLSGGDANDIDQDSFGAGKGIRVDYRYVADPNGSVTVSMSNVSERAPFQVQGFINRIDKLQQWISLAALPDLVAGQTWNLAVGNANATYLNTNMPHGLNGVDSGTYALCTAEGELMGGINADRNGLGITTPGFGTGLPVTFTSSNTNVAIIGSPITAGGYNGTPKGVWIIPVGVGTTTITASAAGDSHYADAPTVSQTLTVRANASAIVTMTAPTNMIYDGTPKNFTARVGTSTAFTYSYVGVSPTVYAASSTAPTAAGDYAVTATCTDPSYPVSKKLTYSIASASNNITLASLPVKTVGDPGFTLSPTNTSAGLPVTFASSDTNVATVSGATVTIRGPGQTTITASQSSSVTGNYSVAPSVSQALVVRAAQSISFGSIPAKVMNGGSFALAATASSGLAVTYQSSDTNVATVSGNTVTIVGTGTAVITANQEGSPTKYGTAPSVSQTLTVAPQELSVEDVVFHGPSNLGYDGNAKPYTVTASFVAKIAAGGANTAVILKNGTVVVWGDNSYGQCVVPPGLNSVERISVGPSHILAMQGPNSNAFKLVAWGNDSYGQVSAFQGARVTSIAAGGIHTVVRSSQGTVESFGRGDEGQTGFHWYDGWYASSWGATNATNRAKEYTPTAGVRNTAFEVYAGGYSTFALTPSASPYLNNVTNVGNVAACGKTYALGFGYFTNETPPADLSDVKSLAVGGTFTVALRNHYTPAYYPTNPAELGTPAHYEKSVVAWGWVDSSTHLASQIAPSLPQTNVAAIAAGYDFALALTDEGEVKKWDLVTRAFSDIPAGLSNVVAIAAGDYHAIALKNDGSVVAWGDNGLGQTMIPTSLLGVSGFSCSYSGKAGTTTVYGPSTNAPTLTGSYTVTATPTDPNYSGATTRDFTITPATLSFASITITPPSSLVYSGTAKTHAASASGVSGFSLSYTGVSATSYGPSTTAPKNVGDYSVTATSTDPNFSGSKTQAFSITQASLGSPDIITLTPLESLEYDRTPKARTATVSGVTNLTYSYDGVSPTVYPVSATAPSNAGTYSVTVTATSADRNYATSRSFPYTITPKALTVTANAASKAFGSSDPAFTYITSGLVAPDALKGSLTRTSGETVGLYDILIGSLSAGSNYSLAFTGAKCAITGTQVFSINPPSSLVYDGTGKPFTATGYKAKAIAAGPCRTLAVLTTGGVVSWGAIAPSNTQELVPGDLTDVTALAAGPSYTLALRSNSTVSAWGTEVSATRSQSILNPPANNGTWNSYQYPQFDGLNGVDSISAGTYHAVALQKKDIHYPTYSKTWAWGVGASGEVGKDLNGYYTYSGYDNPDGYSQAYGWANAKGIAAGFGYTLVLKEDGSVHAHGSLGGLTVPAGLTNVTGIAAGFQHALAIKANGTVVAWGANSSSGQTNVPAGLTNVIAVAAGHEHSMALKSDGTVVVWGNNSSGQTNVPAGLSNVVAISAGDYHSVALKSDGSVVVWGSNGSGQGNVPVALQPGVPVFTYSYKGTGSTAYGPSATPPTLGGTYTVTVTSSLSDTNVNYASSSGSRDFTITGAALSPENITVTPLSTDYTGSGKSVTATARGVSGFSYTYAGVSPTVYASSATPPTNAGTYTATATSTDPSWSGSRSQAFTIVPALQNNAGVTLTAPASLAYSGESKPYTASGAANLSYSYQGTGSTDYPLSAAAPSNAGSYSVTAAAPTADPNYVSGKSVNYSITQKPVAITAVAKGKIYGQTDPALTFTSSGFLGADQPTGALARVAGETVGTYGILQGTLSVGPNYSVGSYMPALLTIRSGQSLTAGSIPFFTGIDTLLPVSVSVSVNSRYVTGLACDGEKFYINSRGFHLMNVGSDGGGTDTYYNYAHTNTGFAGIACSRGYLFARSASGLSRLDKSNPFESSTSVTVDPTHPLPGGTDSLFDMPDGRIGAMGDPSGGVSTVRLYSVSTNGRTLTWSQDYTINDTWNPGNCGTACDGTYLYRLSRSSGYKSYLLSTGGVAYDGTAWRPPAGFDSSSTATYLARNHVTGQFIIAGNTTGSSGSIADQVLITVGLTAATQLTPPESLVYDATPKSYAVAGSWLHCLYQGTGSTTYGPDTNAPTDAGTYTAAVEANDPNLNMDGVKSIAFTITPAVMGLTLTPPASLAYDATAKSYAASVTNPLAGTILRTYTGTGSTSYGPTAVAPTNAGSYSVSVTTAARANFSDGSRSVDFTITPAGISLTPPNNPTYNGAAKSYSTTLPWVSGIVYTYMGTGTTYYEPSAVAPTNAGSYSVTANLPSSGNFSVTGSLTAGFTIAPIAVGSMPWGVLQASTDSVLTLAGSANILGLACNGSNVFVNSGGTRISVYTMAGALVSSGAVSNLPNGANQMAFAGGYLFARNGANLYRISTNDWSSTGVTVDPGYPMLTCAGWMSGSLFDTPDGRIGVMGPTSGGAFTVRLYTVSTNGLTLTRDRDDAISDTWVPDNHGMACDGTYLYRLGYSGGYKSYNLATGAVAYDGTAWRQPSGFANPTFMTRNHVTGQFIVGDFTASQALFSTANPQLSYTTPSSLVYDGTAKAYTPVSSVPVDFTYSYSGTNATTYGPTPTAPSSVGDYVLTAIPNSPNYAGPSPIAFFITPSPIMLIAPTNFVYNGLPKSYGATAAGSPVFLFTYRGTDSTTYGPGTNAPTNAGSYTLSVNVPAAGSNYSPSTADFTITQVDAPSDSITITPPASLVYTATAKTFTATAPGASDFTYTYTGASATTYGPSANAPTNVGSYYLLVTTLAGDPNHTQSRGTAFSITPRPLTVTATALSKQYGATDPVLTYTTAGLQGSDVLTGTVTREAGENLGSYAITRGSLSAGANYSVSYTGANLRIEPSLAFMLSTKKSNVLQTSTDTVLPLAGTANIRGLACDGTSLYVNSGGMQVLVYGLDGSLISAQDVANLPTNYNQMAYAGGHLFARNGGNLYLISTTDWSSTPVSVDPSHPMLWVPTGYLGGSLFDTPDGKIGMMGPVSSDGATFIVRMYTVSEDGLTLTWDHDDTIANSGWNPNEHGTASDGAHLYRLNGSGLDGAAGAAAPDIGFTSVYEEPYVDEWDVSHGGMWTTTVSYGALPSGETLQLVSGDLYHTYGPRGGSWDGWSDFNDDALATLTGDTAGGSFTATTTSEVTGVTPTPPEGSSLPAGGSGYKSYNLVSGTLAYDGTGWTPPAGFADTTFLTRNHVTGQLIVGDLSASQVLLSAAATQLPATTVVRLVYDGTGQNCTASLSGVSGFSYLYEGRNGTTYASSSSPPINVGDYTLTATSTAPGAGGAIRVNFSITPKSVTVTADAKSKASGAADPALTYTTEGLLGSDRLSGNLARATGEASGTYAILPGTLAGSNYAISYTGADLTILVPLLPPTSFLASPTNNQRVSLSWIGNSSSNSVCTGYMVTYSRGGANSWTGISLPSNAVSCYVTNLMAGTAYDFRIASLHSPDISAYATNRAITWTTEEQWRFANFGTISNSGNAADDANPAGDGIKNLTKYAMGIDPSGVNSPDAPSVHMNTDRHLTLSFKRARPELTYTVEGSSDLRTWSNVVVNPGSVGAAVTVTDSAPTNAPSRFLRLKISR